MSQAIKSSLAHCQLFTLIIVTSCCPLFLCSCAKNGTLDELQQSAPSYNSSQRLMVFDVIRNGDAFVAVYDRERKRSSRLTAPSKLCYNPIWAVRRDQIFFTMLEGRSQHVWQINPDGTGVRRITSGAVVDKPVITSNDGSVLYFVRENRKGRLLEPRREIWEVSLERPNQEPSLVGPGLTVSSDGRKRVVAATSRNSAGLMISIASNANSAGEHVCDGFSPNISPDGNKLTYTVLSTNWNYQIWVRDLSTGAAKLIESSQRVISSPKFFGSSDQVAIRSIPKGSNIVDIVFVSIADGKSEHLTFAEPD